MKSGVKSVGGMNRKGIRRLGLLALLALMLMACNEDRSFYDRGVGTGPNVAQAQSEITYEHWHLYESEIPEGTTELQVLLHELSGDADLYVEGPDGEDTCSSIAAGTTDDECVFSNPQAGTWSIDIYGWEQGSYDYTLTVTLAPSDRAASLERVGEVEPGGAASGPMSLDDTAARQQQLGDQLPLLAAVIDLARNQNEPHASYHMIKDEQRQGQLQLSVSEQAGAYRVSFKLVTQDSAEGERLMMATLPGAPIGFAAGANRPDQGVLELRTATGQAKLKLGQHTGTGADIQLLAEPGPVFSEQAWIMEAAGLEFVRE